MVTKMTPSRVPYWNGKSYEPIVYKFIPRFVWPNKPKEEMGQLFGHKYKVIADEDKSTSMNTPIFAEAYMNFGDLGVITISIILGFLMSYIGANINETTFSVNSSEEILNNLQIAQYSVVLTQWESNFSMMIGKIVIIYLSGLLLERVIWFNLSKK
jgi:hypothetical protein